MKSCPLCVDGRVIGADVSSLAILGDNLAFDVILIGVALVPDLDISLNRIPGRPVVLNANAKDVRSCNSVAEPIPGTGLRSTTNPGPRSL